MKTPSLKIRFALVMSTGALALVVGMGVISMVFTQADLLKTLSIEQLDMAGRAATDLDGDLRFAMDALTDAAAVTPADVALDRDGFDAFTVKHPLLLRVFERVFVLDPRGIVVADSPSKGTRVLGLDLGGRAFFKQALSARRTVVSEPLRGKLSGMPLIDVATPIIGPDGNTAGVLVGVLPLTRRSFLGDLSNARIGRTGYFTVLTRGDDAVFVSAPDPARVMQRAFRERDGAVAAMLDATGPGTRLVSRDDGSEVLIAYQPLKTVDWVLATVLPRAEAFDTVEHARERTIVVAVIAALIVLPLVWFFAWVLFRPLARLRAEVEAIARDPGGEALVTAGPRDEVGAVALAFNEMRVGQRMSDRLRRASEQAQRRLVAILENSEDLVAMVDLRGKVTYLNAAARKVSGIDAEADVSTIAMEAHVPPWALAKLRREACRGALRHGVWLGESAIRGRDGREIPIDQTVIAHRGGDGRLEYFSTLMHDTSAAATAAAAMRASEARMLSIADALPVLVSFLDRDHRYRFVNSGYERHFGVARSQILGKSVMELIGADAYRAYAPFLERASRGESLMFEIDSRAGVRPVHLVVKLIPQLDDDGAIVGYHFIHQDVTDHKAENQRLSQLARADALTGLLNRAGFDAAIVDAMARTRHHLSAMAFFYLDVDHFKSINDRYGHPVGDKLLRGFAARLVRAVRSADVAARLGGDEFAVIAEGIRNADDVRSIAGKILRAMRNDFVFDEATLSITVSIGVAIYAGSDIGADTLIGRADTALYRAKAAGRNRFGLDDEMTTFGTTTLMAKHPELMD